MNFRFFIHIIVFTSFIALLGACDNKERDNRQLLDDAAQLMETDHKQAFERLNDVNTNLLSEEEYAWFTLLQVRVWSLEDMNIITSDAAVLSAKDYFAEKNNADKSAYACFVYAHIHYAEGDMDKALFYFLQADEWAKKINYKISYLSYPAIIYNIALIYRKENKLETALFYLNKDIKHINIENNDYVSILYIFELKGILFNELNQPDSALFYSDKALKIAEAHNDIESKARIFHNRARIYTKTKDYTLAEECCRQALVFAQPSNDSTIIGRFYMRLALIHDEMNLLDSAIVNAYKSRDFLRSSDVYYKSNAYELLFQLEKKRGNTKKAGEYKQQYEHYKNAENDNNPETERLKEQLRQLQANNISSMIRVQIKTRDEVKSVKMRNSMISGILCFILLGIGGLVCSSTLKKAKRNLTKLLTRKNSGLSRNLLIWSNDLSKRRLI